MKTVSAAEFKKKYGEAGTALFSQPKPTSGFQAAVKDIPNDLSQAFTGARDAVVKGIEGANSARADVTAGRVSPLAGTVKTIGAGFRAGAEVVGNATLGAAKLFTSPATEQAVSDTARATGEAIVQTQPVQKLIEKYKTLSPSQKAIIDGTLGTAEGLATILGAGPVVQAGRKGIQATAEAAAKGTSTALDAASSAATRARSLFSRPSATVDDVIAQADETIKAPPVSSKAPPAQMRAEAEASQPALSIKEKWVGVSPDIKKRIQGKQAQLREYFDVAHARNADDTLPTPHEYGSQRAQTAVETMEARLNETGGVIGAFRNKIGSYTASTDDVALIEKSFLNQLARLNLQVRNGQIRQTPGTIRKTGSTNDAKILQDFYDDLLIVKQSPTLTNLIDFRSSFDSKINFAKQSREASSSVDPLSRQVRKDIADAAARIVGKSEAAELQKYSDFMDAYNDLRSYTDRRAGGEYLLRLVLSGRGGDARQIIQTIKEYTGIDLMDDATMMTLATDFIGNERQRNLFRQEITKAGLDAASLLKGDTRGIIGTILQKAVDKALDPEKILLDAAK